MTGCPSTVSAPTAPVPLFYPPHIQEILKQKTRESELVMADWYEEQGLERVAFIFRTDEPQLRVWREIIASFATIMPTVEPNDTILILVEAQAKSFIEAEQRFEAMLPDFGVDMTPFLYPESIGNFSLPSSCQKYMVRLEDGDATDSPGTDQK